MWWTRPEVLMEGIAFGESPRLARRAGWFSDWGAHQVIALDADGGHEVVATVAYVPHVHRLPARRAIARRGLGPAAVAAQELAGR